MPRTFPAALCAILLACLVSPSVLADAIYKVRLKDGSIVFTDRPPPGATILDKREFEPAPPPPPLPKKIEPALTGGAATKQQADRVKMDAAVADAERAVAEARAKLEQGRELREGDYIQTARKGFTRKSPAYEERVQALEQAVADAEARLAKAIEARDAAR
ncbi:MAG: DUF4124 domain-containing protein [Gemmatimonadota bacterium]